MRVAIPALTARSPTVTAVKRVAVIAGKNPAGAHLAAAYDSLAIRVTDLVIDATVTVDADVQAEGSTVVPAATFANLLAGVRGRNVTIAAGLGDVTIAHGAFRSFLPPMPAADFPPPLAVRGEALCFTMSGEEVADLQRLAGIVDGARHHLSGVLLRTGGGRVALAAQNDHQRVEIGRCTGPGIIVPAPTARLIGDLLPDGGAFATNDGLLEASAGGVRIVSKLVDASFPDHEMPSPCGSAVTVAAVKLADALAHVGVVASQHNRGAVLGWDQEVAPGELRITLGHSDYGTAVIRLEAQTEGAGRVEIRLDSAVDLFAAAAATTVRLDHAGGAAPILIACPDKPQTVAVLSPWHVRSDVPLLAAVMPRQLRSSAMTEIAG